MTDETKGGFIVGFICAVLLFFGIYFLLSFVVSLIRKFRELKNKKEHSVNVPQITITPEDVDIIREALAFSRTNYSNLYENNGADFQKARHDQIVALQKQLTGIANQSSAIIEVSK